MRERILITGSSGVLGSALKAIDAAYPDCEFIYATKKECDLRDFNATLDYMRALAPDSVMHLAALSGGIALTLNSPATVLRDNILMNMNVLEVSRIAQVKKLLMTLSSGMYPSDAPIPFKEESIHNGPAHASNYSYSYAKRLIEPAIRAYRQQYGMNLIGVVPNGIFGEHDDFDPESSSMVAALIRRFYENRSNKDKLVVWGDGTPLRELTYSKDMARAFMWCFFKYDSPQILNVGTTEEHTVKDIAYMISEELGIDRARIVFDTTKPSGIKRKSSDNSKFTGLSHFSYTPFRKALRSTINWVNESKIFDGSPTRQQPEERGHSVCQL